MGNKEYKTSEEVKRERKSQLGIHSKKFLN